MRASPIASTIFVSVAIFAVVEKYFSFSFVAVWVIGYMRWLVEAIDMEFLTRGRILVKYYNSLNPGAPGAAIFDLHFFHFQFF